MRLCLIHYKSVISTQRWWSAKTTKGLVFGEKYKTRPFHRLDGIQGEDTGDLLWHMPMRE
jgi:hypothetical protein